MYGISLDVGTSGIRGHAIELSTGKIISTAMTQSHPLPGANAMDHLTFCMRMGKNLAHNIYMRAINRLVRELDVNLGRVDSVSICGNPVQMSIFQNMYVDDLAFTGEKARRIRGITQQDRNARELAAVDVGLDLPDRTRLYVPPAVKHDIGADSLAMLLKSGFMERTKNCMITDYGTSAEMALKVDGEIYTGSAAAGPCMEGLHIKYGMLASPGAISDMEYEFHWRCKVIGEDLLPADGDLIDLGTKTLISEGPMHRKARGITGAGMIALVDAIMHARFMRKGKISLPKGRLDLQDGLFVTQDDVMEVCRAIGAIRAGHFSLIEHAGVSFDDLNIMYMTGATGLLSNAVKARNVGLVPPKCNEIHQMGDASLDLATDIIRRPELLDELQDTAENLRSKHVAFSMDDVFEQIYVQELAHWDEGMSMDMYNENLELAGIQQLPRPTGTPAVYNPLNRGPPDIGKTMAVVREIGTELIGKFEHCTMCKVCQKECPESALRVDVDGTIRVRTKNCLGTACYRCQYKCPMKVYRFEEMKLVD